MEKISSAMRNTALVCDLIRAAQTINPTPASAQIRQLDPMTYPILAAKTCAPSGSETRLPYARAYSIDQNQNLAKTPARHKMRQVRTNGRAAPQTNTVLRM